VIPGAQLALLEGVGHRPEIEDALSLNVLSKNF
jgi:hypothetical protein